MLPENIFNCKSLLYCLPKFAPNFQPLIYKIYIFLRQKPEKMVSSESIQNLKEDFLNRETETKNTVNRLVVLHECFS